MKKAVAVFITIFGLFFLNFSPSYTKQKAEDKKLPKIFTSQRFGYQLTYPATWELEADEENNYVSLYSPESLLHQKETLELISGLKIEIISQSDLENQDFLNQNNFKQIASAGQLLQYELQDSDCYYLATTISLPKTPLLILGYIPQKKLISKYSQQYQAVVSSLKY